MKQLKHRVLSMLVLAAILVPMVTLGVFAGSRQQPLTSPGAAQQPPSFHGVIRLMWVIALRITLRPTSLVANLAGDRIHVGGAS